MIDALSGRRRTRRNLGRLAGCILTDPLKCCRSVPQPLLRPHKACTVLVIECEARQLLSGQVKSFQRALYLVLMRRQCLIAHSVSPLCCFPYCITDRHSTFALYIAFRVKFGEGTRARTEVFGAFVRAYGLCVSVSVKQGLYGLRLGRRNIVCDTSHCET